MHLKQRNSTKCNSAGQHSCNLAQEKRKSKTHLTILLNVQSSLANPIGSKAAEARTEMVHKPAGTMPGMVACTTVSRGSGLPAS